LTRNNRETSGTRPHSKPEEKPSERPISMLPSVETACLGKGESPGHAPGRSFAFCQETGSIVPFLEKELVDFDTEGGTIRFQSDP
jgi:hypothetical protein